jgi:hypothetical protein
MDVLEAKADLGRWFDSSNATRYFSTYSSTDPTDPMPLGFLDGKWTQRLIQRQGFWVDPDMCRLASIAAQSLPAEAEVEPATPQGFIYLELPNPLSLHDGFPLQMQGVTWDETIMFGLYRLRRALVPTEWPIPYRDSIIFEASLWHDLHSIVSWAKTYWLLLAQRLSTQTAARIDRATRRRCRHRSVPDNQTVEIVSLRRSAIEESQSCDEPRSIEWTHRWMVDGHWRNQWYPSDQAHRFTWIAPYIKGPPDKPFVLREKVYRWHR